MLHFVNEFKKPSAVFQPKVRWWWPGGDVQIEELRREIQLLATHSFGGAEIQPFVAGIKAETIADPTSPIHDYGSDVYYEKVVAVLEEAQKHGLQIDLTMGSGWHAGGKMVPIEDNIDTLLYGEATVNAEVVMSLPAPEMPYAYTLFTEGSASLPMLEPFKVLKYHPEQAKLVAIVAARIVDNKRSTDPTVLTDTIHLELATAVDLTDQVKDGQLQWKPPSQGEWQVIAIYTMPSGSRVLLTADTEENYMVDPFDSEAITQYYNNWIGSHPELLKYAGTTLRALFNDSYEYFTQRFFSDDFIETFRANRGYDITPFLPVVLEPGVDQAFFRFSGLATAPEFSFGEISERIIHDYNLTISDLFFKHWYPTSREWIESRDLQFRQQGYNPPLDVIKAGGAASIPETEALEEHTLKRVTSGGHLYGRPLIAAESFVFYPGGTFSITPQKYKQGIDVLMTSGVNEIIYHGMPYRWEEPGYGEFGWSPFSSPHAGMDISTTISEADTAFWPYQQEINTYASRLQFLLRQGSPSADLLVYLPVFGDPNDQAYTTVVQVLNTSGHAWEWVNDELITEAEWSNAGIKVGKMMFQGIVLPNVECLPLSTAKRLAELALAGAPIVIYGKRPSQQPGYYDYEANDRIVVQNINTVINQPQCALIESLEALAQYVCRLPKGRISYEANKSLRFIRRDLDNEGHLAFIRNVTGELVHFTLTVDPTLTTCYWFEATSGHLYKAILDDGVIRGMLTEWQSITLICGSRTLFAESDLATGNPVGKREPIETISLTDWTLEVTGADVPGGEISISREALGDWSQHKDLMYVSSPGVYTTELLLNELDPAKQYVLDLGTVHSAATVIVNGWNMGHTIYSPHQIDVTSQLRVGMNSIIVKVTPALRNRLLGKAKSGDPEYAQFRVGGFMSNVDPISSGWVGPVTLNINAI